MYAAQTVQSSQKTKKNKTIYYCQFYDVCGRRMTAVSTGQNSKSTAEAWAYEQLKAGHLPLQR